MRTNSLSHLANAKSLNNSTSLVTFYVPGSTKVSDVSRMVNSEMSKTHNIKSRQTRQQVSDALQAVSSHLKTMKTMPENGIAIFTGHTTETFENTVIEPLRTIDRSFYHCDSKFWV
jgi:peptide subunit release factor 1 (eRF1)